MYYNQGNRDNGYDDENWDRWNSNSSHSSYYNQPTHRPYGQAFAIASLVLGLLSVTIGCCGFSLPLGALGILFALLGSRKGRKMESTARTGLILSVIGLIMGIFLTIISFLLIPLLMQNDAYRELFNNYFRAGTGMELEEYLESLQNYNGITFTE